MFTAESFGSDCPVNWEEIVAFLNNYCEDHEIDCEDREETDAVWEAYFRGELPGAPKYIMSE